MGFAVFVFLFPVPEPVCDCVRVLVVCLLVSFHFSESLFFSRAKTTYTNISLDREMEETGGTECVLKTIFR